MIKLLNAWIFNLKLLVSHIFSDPFCDQLNPSVIKYVKKPFSNPPVRDDKLYAILLVVLSMLAGTAILVFSAEKNVQKWAHFFSIPVHLIVSGLLGSFLVFFTCRLNRVTVEFSQCIRVIAIVAASYPFLVLLEIHPLGQSLRILVFGFLVIRTLRAAIELPLRNVMLFLGATYFVFAAFQMQSHFTNNGPNLRQSSLLLLQEPR